MKLSEAVDQYVSSSGNLRTDHSRHGTRQTARELVAYCGDRAMSTYTTEELTGFCLGTGGRGTAPNTIRVRKARIQSFFDWCAWQKIIARNPATDLRFTVRVRGGGVREHTWLTLPEVLDIAHGFDLADPLQHRNYIIFRTSVMLGLRRSEMAGLEWSSFRRGFAEVSFVGKGRKLATCPIPRELRVDLARWRAAQPDGAVFLPAFKWSLLPGHTGSALMPQWHRPIASTDVIYKVVKAIARAHGFPALAPHDLRRSLAGIMEKKGLTIRELQALLRHAELATTDRYMEKNPGRLAEVIEHVQWGAS